MGRPPSPLPSARAMSYQWDGQGCSGSDVAGAKPSVEMGKPWENAKRIQIRAIVFIPISSGLNWFPLSQSALYPRGGERA